MARKGDVNAEQIRRLKLLREKLGFTQRDLAHEFQVSPGAVALWEGGQHAIPGPVLQLIELYERSLGTDDARGAEIEEACDDVSRDLFAAVKLDEDRAAQLKTRFRSSLRSWMGDSISQDALRRRVQLTVARRLAGAAARSRGVPMKIAQLASYLEPSIPRGIREVFAELQVSGRPMPPGQAARVIHQELGKAPHAIFAEWDPRPFAAASIGQVHLARLRSGEKVAVKVQYPGITEKMESHLKTFGLLHALFSLFRDQPAEVLEEIRQRVVAECDYVREADFQRKFRDAFAGDARVFVPRVFDELSSGRVITMEFAEGDPLAKFARSASQSERDLAGMTFARFHMHAVFGLGMLQGDPQPGNYLFSGKRIAFLDYGRAFAGEPENLALQKRLYQAAVLEDSGTGRRLLKELGLVRDWETFDFDGFWRFLVKMQAHAKVDAPFRFTPEYVEGLSKAAKDFPGRKNLMFQRNFFWGFFISASMWSILADLGAEGEWRRCVEKYWD